MSSPKEFTSRRFQREFAAAQAAADSGEVVTVRSGARRYSFRRENPRRVAVPPPGLNAKGRKAWALSERALAAGMEPWDDERIQREVRERRGGLEADSR